MSSNIANLSSSSMDLLGKGAMTSRADSSRSGSLTSLAAPSASSQLEFKRLLSEASEKKSAAKETSDRQQAEKQAQSERLEAKRHESRQLEKQQQQERQAAKQNEERQIEEKQQESRQSEHRLRENMFHEGRRQEDRLTQAAQQKRLQDDATDTQRSVTQGTEIPFDIHDSSLNEPSAFNEPSALNQPLVSDKPSATTQPSELQSLTGMDNVPETGELSAEDSAKDKEGASNAAVAAAEAGHPGKAGGERPPLFSASPDAAETLVERPKTGLAQNPVSVNEVSASAGLAEGEISLEAIAEAVAAFTGLGEIRSGGLSASQSVLASSAGSVNGLSLGASGTTSQFSLVQNLSLSGSTTAGALNGLALDNNSLASGKTAGTEQSPLMGAVVAGTAAVTVTTGTASRQMSPVTAAQPQAVDQALDAFSAESGTAGQDSSGDSSREGLRGGAGDNPLLAAAQRSEGRSAGPAQSATHFTVPTSKGELGQPEWHNAVAEKVAVMATKNLSSAEIQLDPPELGQLQVRVTLNQEQASVSFASQNAAVREALDQTAFRLREMFDAEGLNLVDVDVSDQSFQQQRQQQESVGSDGEGVIGTDDVPAEPVVVKRSQGLVDHFV